MHRCSAKSCLLRFVQQRDQTKLHIFSGQHKASYHQTLHSVNVERIRLQRRNEGSLLSFADYIGHIDAQS